MAKASTLFLWEINKVTECKYGSRNNSTGDLMLLMNGIESARTSIDSVSVNELDAVPNDVEINSEHNGRSIAEVNEDEDEDEQVGTRRRRRDSVESETDIEEAELARKVRRSNQDSIVDVDDSDLIFDPRVPEAQQVTAVGETRHRNTFTSETPEERPCDEAHEVVSDEAPAEVLEGDNFPVPQNIDQDESDDSDSVEECDDNNHDINILTEEEQIKAQQVIEIDDEDEAEGHKGGKDLSETPLETKKAADYVCPICMEPPEAALVTKCGHVFCTPCLYGMVNSSKGNGRRNGLCALCRENVKLQDLRLIIMRKSRIRKPN
ncbi:unnamed protein product [Kluyveromyces dobzhanskii CBS 2104]|uniref:WGS project CCBQ000000000 data, contig 00106 n=1 Tax=Kluyveromyces dobzhanskii CBS 2104 TaxID=1427455 RepID=A0A0A8L883_9SACH|nr:unnamed protein product [Kluyveromyces dobzhanskii CBS 2104]